VDQVTQFDTEVESKTDSLPLSRGSVNPTKSSSDMIDRVIDKVKPSPNIIKENRPTNYAALATPKERLNSINSNVSVKTRPSTMTPKAKEWVDPASANTAKWVEDSLSRLEEMEKVMTDYRNSNRNSSVQNFYNREKVSKPTRYSSTAVQHNPAPDLSLSPNLISHKPQSDADIPVKELADHDITSATNSGHVIDENNLTEESSHDSMKEDILKSNIDTSTVKSLPLNASVSETNKVDLISLNQGEDISISVCLCFHPH
jgi:hypothetical protein